ncbi:MAG: PLDc N-terminal domain-containing protein [Alphaproteobacteria bacterium]|nr:hypothetical protein [Rhodospirillaceae bacterium]MDG2481182.1 PLDc N-terminal domain-containing protein [Alphaproteobacteria bacterium]MBT6205136.1 hypothetical protein [Rhodospirillaceae bacterium]MBT6509341.1 hypothetical protein [Rhodospirillaceae bacterium]MBT7612043.1 hypothetical protein [Rhodospirillaceae bacterium]
MGIEVVGLFGLIFLALWIWSIVSIVQSNASTFGKVVWNLVVLLLSYLGFFIWLIFGPKSVKRS